jgi:dihydrofolate synthase / folylpolyglutamate synthase
MSDPLTGYETAVAWLFSTQEKGVKLGLDNIRRLLDALDNPEKSLRFFHVAGTNGKGSVCALLESILRAEGFRTGLFTSPHLVRFNERIQIAGVAIEDESIVSGIERIRALIDEKHHPTFFEITTALALDYFRRDNVDLVLLETGLGGRMDATNVVAPLVSVLTSIDLDHQKWLGATLSEIAFEKGGIIKPGVPVVSVPQLPEVCAVIDGIAQEKATVVTYVDAPVGDWNVALPGSHQRVNAAAAITAIQVAGISAGQKAIEFGLANAIWPGRFQIIDKRIILDGAHNASATKRLVQTWREKFCNQRPVIIFGGLADKDLAAMTAILSEIALHFFLVPISNSRAASPFEIRDLLPAGAHFTLCSSVKEALEEANSTNNPILITGSLFLAGEALSILQPAHGILQSSSQ